MRTINSVLFGESAKPQSQKSLAVNKRRRGQLWGKGIMKLTVIDTTQDEYGRSIEVIRKNPNVGYVCFCDKCGEGYGTSNQYGSDETCNVCGAPLDQKRWVKW